MRTPRFSMRVRRKVKRAVGAHPGRTHGYEHRVCQPFSHRGALGATARKTRYFRELARIAGAMSRGLLMEVHRAGEQCRRTCRQFLQVGRAAGGPIRGLISVRDAAGFRPEPFGDDVLASGTHGQGFVHCVRVGGAVWTQIVPAQGETRRR